MSGAISLELIVRQMLGAQPGHEESEAMRLALAETERWRARTGDARTGDVTRYLRERFELHRRRPCSDARGITRAVSNRGGA